MIVAPLVLLLGAPMMQASEPPITGPGLLCLKYSSFALLTGERVVQPLLGIETMHLEIEGPHGRYWIHESEILAAPARRRLFQTRRDASVYSLGEGSYAFRANLSFSLNGDRAGKPMDRFFASIGGDALRRAPEARAILSRLKLGVPEHEHCQMWYQYGWEYALPPETK